MPAVRNGTWLGSGGEIARVEMRVVRVVVNLAIADLLSGQIQAVSRPLESRPAKCVTYVLEMVGGGPC